MGTTHTKVHSKIYRGSRMYSSLKLSTRVHLELLDEEPGKVRVLSNEGTEEDPVNHPGCVHIWLILARRQQQVLSSDQNMEWHAAL